MIVVTVSLLILNQMDLHLIHNQKENCRNNLIPFNVKGSGNVVFSVYQKKYERHFVHIILLFEGELLPEESDEHAIRRSKLKAKMISLDTARRWEGTSLEKTRKKDRTCHSNTSAGETINT